jgi:hypothetical protein
MPQQTLMWSKPRAVRVSLVTCPEPRTTFPRPETTKQAEEMRMAGMIVIIHRLSMDDLLGFNDSTSLSHIHTPSECITFT